MVFPLRQIINFAMKNPPEVDRAYRNFFGLLPFSMLKTEWEELFFEWLIFDFKTTSKTSFLIEYILKNPDSVEESVLNQLSQIAETHHYSQFEVNEIKKGEWIEIEDLFQGKIYRVYDKKGSETIPSRGTIPVRIAKVNEKWYLVGANSVFFPVTHTKRAKKHMRSLNNKGFSPKDTVDFLREQDKKPFPDLPKFSKKEIQTTRFNLKKRYENLIKRSKISLSFAVLIEEIYQEERTNVLDFWKNLEKKGLSFETLTQNIDLFQDIWNYFPHKCLNNFSPVEIFTKLKTENSKF